MAVGSWQLAIGSWQFAVGYWPFTEVLIPGHKKRAEGSALSKNYFKKL